jgi:uncharacterized RDD family membrane protein YckC
MSTLRINTAFNLDLEFECAPFVKRFLALIIDNVIMFLYIWFIAKFIDSAALDTDENLELIIILLLSVPVFFYHLFFEILYNGASPGKRIANLRVISADGTKPTISQFFTRWICNPSGFLLFGIAMTISAGGVYSLMFGIMYIADFFCVLLQKYGQRLGDIAAGTVVVTTKLPYSLYDTIYVEVDEKNYKVKYPQVIKLSDKDINTINNVLSQHKKYSMHGYLGTLSHKIEQVLGIQSEGDNEEFLRTLLNDYNYLSQKD